MANPIILAILGGGIPTLLWLFFWIREDRDRPEPLGLIIITFIIGGFLVFPVIPFQRLVETYISDQQIRIILWSAIEEIIKFGVIAYIVFKSKYVDEPIDFAMYLIAGALGFAAVENTLYLLRPFTVGDTVVALFTGQLRFLGATLLHALASAVVGIWIGFTVTERGMVRRRAIIAGVITAIILHALFNFFIMHESGAHVIRSFAFLWGIGIIIILLIEKLRRLPPFK